MRLPEAFAQFHGRIALTPFSEERINSAWGRLHAYLVNRFDLADVFVYIQGSYANDTAVKPADQDGEYDLDIVSVHVEDGTPAEDAIEELTATLALDADLADRIEPNKSGRPCVRLRYADDPEGFGFHVDVVPARGQDPTATIEVPMRGQEGWRNSAPYAYTQWCQAQADLFPRTVRFLKRWRDEHGEGSVPSIVLQVLIASHLNPTAASDAEAVAGTLISMREILAQSPGSAPTISNPVLPAENLAERWDDDDYTKFCGELNEAVVLAEEALAAPDEQASHDAWVRLFGDDFPASPENVEKIGGGTPPPPPPDYPDQRQQAPTDERYG
jgi:predicted nucleotidyltransferase